MNEKSVLVSLGDERLKEISEVIGNKTCNKILDFLAEKEATISEVSQGISIPLNTTDYNIKKLVRVGLIEKSSHFWSVKGKKMPVYRTSNKKIIISPKRYKSSLSYIFVLGLTGLVALGVKTFVKKDSEVLMAKSFDIIESGVVERVSSGFFLGFAGWEWFLIGAWLAILLFFVFSMISERRAKK